MTPPVRRWELAAISAVAAIFAILRYPLLLPENVLLGWNSDAAVFGLMAKRIAEGTEWPIFFWGQSYMGPLTSYIAAAIGLLLPDGHWPLALRLATWVESLGAIVFTWLGLRIAFDRITAIIVAALLALGPEFILRFNIAPIGAEQTFFLGAILFWFSVRTLARGGFRPRDWLVFGLLSGFGWWINQGTIFVIGATLVVVFLSSDFWATAWPEPRIVDRLLLRNLDRLGWRPLDLATRILIRGIGYLLMAWYLIGLVRSADIDVPAFFLYSPALEPLYALLIFHVVVELLFGTRLRAALREHLHLKGPALFALGFLIAHSPVIVGGMLDLYARVYGLSVPPQVLATIPRKLVRIVRSDVWLLLGATPTPLGIAYGIAAGASLLFAIYRGRRTIAGILRGRAQQYGPRALCGVIILAAAIFYISSTRAHHGAARYIVVALAPIWAFAFEGRRRIAAILAAAAIAASSLGVVKLVRDMLDESWAMFPGKFDPRPVVARIERAGYQVCYTDYWIAYKLQFLSNERVRLIPFLTYDRRPDETQRLSALPVPKCYVENDGTVRPYGPQDELRRTRTAPVRPPDHPGQ